MSEHLLSVQNLHTAFKTDSGEVSAVNGMSFDLDRGEILGIVGESGSGKSVSAYSIMRILADNGSIKSGKILYKGEDIT
ncbi:MAG: ATP-binding cassette domain-containing protein, partial [Treponemataceae bacterium]|nr:ATP-binding cassette domain-containing protein [Treponemataceae bacterium]